MADELIANVAPVTRRVRAYFAPVDRVTGQATIFAASGLETFNVDAPSAPWVDLGWCRGFARSSGSKVVPLVAGAPGVAVGQARTAIDAEVSLEFESWGKLQLALSAGVQQMNLLRTQAGVAVPAVPLTAGSTSTSASALDVGVPAAAGFAIGDIVAVDLDYGGQTGFVGSAVSGGYVKSAAAVGNDVDYVRRVTLNVGRVTGIAAGVLTLGSGLLAGVPAPPMQVSRVVGFCDREGGSFFQEWSAIFLGVGEQGDRVVFHYPRLQSVIGPTEAHGTLSGSPEALLQTLRLRGSFRALPVKDENDGEMVVCYRSYLPAPMRAV